MKSQETRQNHLFIVVYMAYCRVCRINHKKIIKPANRCLYIYTIVVSFIITSKMKRYEAARKGYGRNLLNTHNNKSNTLSVGNGEANATLLTMCISSHPNLVQSTLPRVITLARLDSDTLSSFVPTISSGIDGLHDGCCCCWSSNGGALRKVNK